MALMTTLIARNGRAMPDRRRVRTEVERRWALRNLGAGVYEAAEWPLTPDRR